MHGDVLLKFENTVPLCLIQEQPRIFRILCHEAQPCHVCVCEECLEHTQQTCRLLHSFGQRVAQPYSLSPREPIFDGRLDQGPKIYVVLMAASVCFMAIPSQINQVEFMSTEYKFQLLSLFRQHKNLPGGNLSKKPTSAEHFSFGGNIYFIVFYFVALSYNIQGLCYLLLKSYFGAEQKNKISFFALQF